MSPCLVRAASTSMAMSAVPKLTHSTSLRLDLSWVENVSSPDECESSSRSLASPKSDLSGLSLKSPMPSAVKGKGRSLSTTCMVSPPQLVGAALISPAPSNVTRRLRVPSQAPSDFRTSPPRDFPWDDFENSPSKVDPATLWGDKKVRDYMKPNPVCVNSETSLKHAAKIMASRNLSGLPVVEPFDNDTHGTGKLVGVLSQKDIMWKECSPYPEEADHLNNMPYYWNYLNEGPMMSELKSQVKKIMASKVADAMTPNPMFVEENASMAEAAEMLLNHNVSRLPVVAPREGGRPGLTVVGIITGKDILRHTILLL